MRLKNLSKSKLLVIATGMSLIAVLSLTGCGNAKEISDQPNNVSVTPSVIYGGKCILNQTWLEAVERAANTPTYWKGLYELFDHGALEDFWGLDSYYPSDGVIEDYDLYKALEKERMDWIIYVRKLTEAIIAEDYTKAGAIYGDFIYPIMKKMDLRCGIFTGKTGLSSTILP